MLALRELERLRLLDEMKSEFVSNVSHELRSPLAVIKSYVQAILDEVDPDDSETQREFLTVINDETDRLADLVSDLLDISRIESGRFEVELSPVPLSDIIKTVLRDFENLSSNHQILTDIPSVLPDLLADNDKMVQVFINLITNAIKFSPDGGQVYIKVGIEGKMIKCDISDQGIGIAEEHIPRLFEKFYRVDNSDVYEISGTGLGLSIVKHIIDSHGGDISVTSTLGEGSTFSMLLPFHRN